jgi:hypothetical protein
MSLRELRELLDQVPDTRELILRQSRGAGPSRGVLYDAWNDAHKEAEEALLRWRDGGGADAYAAYRAAQDREDAAQDALFRAVADERLSLAVARERERLLLAA